MQSLARLMMVSAVAVLGAGGCNRQSGAPEALPPGLVLSEAPGGAADIAAIRNSAKVGAEVVLRGRVGGNEEPVESGVASFRLVDVSLKPCTEGGEMPKCATPWDYCCDDFDKLQAHSATVRVVNADGRPLRAGMSGIGGLKPLGEVTVKGTVATADEGRPLVIHATGIYVVKP
jgi:hypothetical protein